ncbi:hypothetical protein CONLIGDRAFT_399617 [Coniochaeta ligniaria NRRL 30616]|uniref:Uncharacterized protein n=1 Tax=Coniochaeta ligniaria NRRL 30616 TaxID=1408157 RepID=A0A1J7ING5_9PEZI|nr:hypothetical protein CONLIGDRAFT_399617 [Coniochaeta ligniaria NRRL 30616]
MNLELRGEVRRLYLLVSFLGASCIRQLIKLTRRLPCPSLLDVTRMPAGIFASTFPPTRLGAIDSIATLPTASHLYLFFFLFDSASRLLGLWLLPTLCHRISARFAGVHHGGDQDRQQALPGASLPFHQCLEGRQTLRRRALWRCVIYRHQHGQGGGGTGVSQEQRRPLLAARLRIPDHIDAVHTRHHLHHHHPKESEISRPDQGGASSSRGPCPWQGCCRERKAFHQDCRDNQERGESRRHPERHLQGSVCRRVEKGLRRTLQRRGGG